MKCGFNTGRFYNEIGQPITAEVVGDVIVFFDHARHIDGEIPLAKFGRGFDSVMSMARHVLYMYDHGQFNYVRSHDEPAFESKREQQRLGYDGWMAEYKLSPVQKFMLT